MAVPDKSVCVHIFFVSNGHPGGVVVVILHFPGLLERLRVQIRLRVNLPKSLTRLKWDVTVPTLCQMQDGVHAPRELPHIRVCWWRRSQMQ